MPFEITCGQCSGQLLVDAAGVIVECPLCGAHLSVPEPEATPDSYLGGALVAPITSADSQIMAQPASQLLSRSQLSGVLAPPPTVVSDPDHAPPPPQTPIPEAIDSQLAVGGDVVMASPAAQDDSPADAGPLTEELPVLQEEQRMAEDPTQVINRQTLAAGQAATSVADEVPEETHVPAPAPEQPPLVNSPWSMPADEPSTPPSHSLDVGFNAGPATFAAAGGTAASSSGSGSTTSATDAVSSADFVPKQRFIMVAGYASAVTLLAVYLLYSSWTLKPHLLESLPDLVPEIRKDGAVGMPRVKPEWNVAPGHELRIGESRRFGSVRVTPVKITRGPIEFVHAYGNQRETRAPTAPVLKLWLKFENVSSDQTFPPLDRTLVFRRLFDERSRRMLSLNYLAERAERRADGELHYIYDLPEFSEYELKGQGLDHPLKPGESWETYIPSEEGLAQVDGEWVWRVHVRKGYNPESGRGVTTLIDVKFDADEIEAETPQTT